MSSAVLAASRTASPSTTTTTTATDYGDDIYDDYGEDDDWIEDGYYEIDEEYEQYEPDDQGAPPELEEAADKCEEALAAYHESRQKMRELANARGFYPVVALASGHGLPAAAPPPASPETAGQPGVGHQQPDRVDYTAKSKTRFTPHTQFYI